MNLSIKKYAGFSVVPITCGGEHGTAFFIDSTHLLTANHVVRSNIENSRKLIYISIQGIPVKCHRVTKCGEEADIQILQCENFKSEYYIPLLESKKCIDGIPLKIIGYPEELGNGVECLGVEVVNYKQYGDFARGYDVIVARKDIVMLNSYEGYSGSPVLNEKGYAVGVAIKQMYDSLGYASFDPEVAAYIKSESISLYDNADIFDTSPLGLGSAIAKVQEWLNQAGKRYTRKAHVPDNRLEECLKAFCHIQYDEEEEYTYKYFKKWYNDVIKNPKIEKFIEKEDREKILSSFMKSKKFESAILDFFEYLLDKKDPEYKGSNLLQNPLRRQLRSIYTRMSKLSSVQQYAESQFGYITGRSGTGKTHNLCSFVDNQCEKVRFYLYYGTSFPLGSSPVDEIVKNQGWEQSQFQQFQERLEDEQKYAIFIIDAVNEGAGVNYWMEHIEQLQTHFAKYPRLKVLLSLRSMESTDQFSEKLNTTQWNKIELSGFANTRNAIEKHFEVYGIQESIDTYVSIPEFRSPLFLHIFCETYHCLSWEERRTPDRMNIYRHYLKYRNTEVSEIVDEDPENQATSKLLDWMAEESVRNNHCRNLNRTDVLRKANRICRYRLWSHNLMNVMLQKNLLIEYYYDKKQSCIGFEYDNLGDFLRAEKMLILLKEDPLRIETFITTGYKYLQSHQEIDSTHFYNTCVSLFALWNPSSQVLQRIVDEDKKLMKHFFLGSLSFRNIQDKRSRYLIPIILSMVEKDSSLLSPAYMLEYFHVFSNIINPVLHEYLINMKMTERDLVWSTKVNEEYDEYYLMNSIRSVSLDGEKAKFQYMVLLCWMLTSSYPILRYKIVRLIEVRLEEIPDMGIELLELFHKIDDPMVIEGLLSAIYGLLLKKRDSGLTMRYAQDIFYYFYSTPENIPSNIIVRQWSMKILEWDNVLNSQSNCWSSVIAQLPFSAKRNLFDGTDKSLDEDFFGTTNGAKRLYDSLFAWDFNRYIIGTNSNINSRNLIFRDGTPVNLDRIAIAIGLLIKEYGWNDELGKYDGYVSTGIDRYDKRKERFGKKYQWLGFYQVLSWLCDTCNIRLDLYCDTERDAKYPFPWYTEKHSRFDPTLDEYERLSDIARELIEDIPSYSILESDKDKWIEDDSKLPDVYQIMKDKEGNDWIILNVYDNQEEMTDGIQQNLYIHYRSVLVKNDDIQVFAEWSQVNNPDAHYLGTDGDYEFLWNEIPWSDSFKQRGWGENLSDEINSPCEVWSSICSQAQENIEGTEQDDDILGTAYSPCEDILRKCYLHTAERGLIRSDKNSEIVAINNNPVGERMNGLIIKKSVLDEYLTNTKKTLFVFMSGYKQLQSNIQILKDKRFNGVYRYNPVEGFVDVSPLSVIPEQKPKISTEMSDSNWDKFLSIMKAGGDISDWLEES